MRYLDVPPKKISRSCCQRFALWLSTGLFTYCLWSQDCHMQVMWNDLHTISCYHRLRVSHSFRNGCRLSALLWGQVLVCTFKIRWALKPGSLFRGLCSGGSAHLKLLWQKWVSDQSTSKGSQQGVCPGFALLHEHYPRQCHVQWSENIPSEAGNIPTDFKEILKQKGNINLFAYWNSWGMRYKRFLVCFRCSSSEDSSFGLLHTLNLSNISTKCKM